MPPSVTTNYGRTRSFLNELTLISYLGITRSSPQVRPQLLMNAQKVPAAAVTTTEVSRVLVRAGTGYKTIKSLVMVNISIKSNYVELTCQMICICLIS